MLDWTISPLWVRFQYGKEAHSKKQRQPDYQQVARKVLDTVAPDAEPKAIKPAKAPRRPKGKQDAADLIAPSARAWHSRRSDATKCRHSRFSETLPGN